MGPPPAAGPAASGAPRERRSPWGFVAIGLVVLLVAGAVGAFLVLAGDDEAAADEVFLEPVGSDGENPFAPSIVEPDAQPADPEALEPLEDTGGAFEGGTVGLYGGTRDAATCDRAQLVEFLEANDAEAEAWAGVLGIEVSEIADHVDTLTPVVLRSDTAVTNHGFRDGEATAFQAVLQAGTAVLVDDFGEPVVKCSCGNPLRPPQQVAAPTYTGPRWERFAPEQITIIQRTTVEIDVYVIVDVETGEPFGRPAGTDGDDDGPPPDEVDPLGTTTTTEAPTTTTTEGVPAQASYAGSASLTCAGTTTSGPVSATVSDGTISITGEGGTVSGPIGADGGFSVGDASGTVTGTVTSSAVTGSVSGQGCSGTMTLDRTG